MSLNKNHFRFGVPQLYHEVLIKVFLCTPACFLFLALSLCTNASSKQLESLSLDKQRSLLQANLISQLIEMLSAVRDLSSDEAVAARRRQQSKNLDPDDLRVMIWEG